MDLRSNIFLRLPIRTDILHRVVVWQLAKRRQGTHKTKSRSEVKGGGKKPWPQKGLGRARAGSIRSPIFRHGGHCHPKRPRDYSYGKKTNQTNFIFPFSSQFFFLFLVLPKQVKRIGLANALTTKHQQGNLFILDSIEIEKPKTKLLLSKVANFEGNSFLIVGPETISKNLQLSSSTLPNVHVLSCRGLNVYDLLRRDVIIMSKEAVEWLQNKLVV